MGVLINYGTNSITLLQAFLLFLSCFCLQFCTAIDTITPTQFIRDSETIISNGEIFKLGFFSPNGSTNRYAGIWYNHISVTTVIWVANRDKPLNDSSGIVTISDGNLLVLNGQKEILWSSNVSDTITNSSAQLLDSGKLQLRDNNDGTIIWDSFEHPSDSFLPKMKIRTNVRTDKKQHLTSWKSPSDPSIGSFSAGIDALGIPQFFIWNGSRPYWRSGPWNGQLFIGVSGMNSFYLDGFDVVDDKEGNVYTTYAFAEDESSLLEFVLNSQGTLLGTYWDDGKGDWEVCWSSLETKCDIYSKCGAFGSCNGQNSPICSCLRGFEPMHLGCVWMQF